MPSLESAIEEAVKNTPLPANLDDEVEKINKQDLSNIKVDDKVEHTEEKKEEKKPPVSTTEPDPDTEKALQLFKALQDPQSAGTIIDFLARQNGYTKEGAVETKKDVKDATTDLVAILEKNLGDEFKFLAPKLAPAIKEAMEALRSPYSTSDEVASLKERLDRQELIAIEHETITIHNSLVEEYFPGQKDMPDNVLKAMNTALDEFPPTDPKMSPTSYYKKIFNMVVGELGLIKKSAMRGDASTRNRADAPARELSQSQRGITPASDGAIPKRMTIEESVRLAIQQVEQASNRK